jgi:AbiTii
MTLLETIQQSAIDTHTDLSTVLRQCRLLAARLDSGPLEEWVVWESGGYPSTADVPPYRVWPLEVRGHFSRPFQSMAKNYLVPPVVLPENVRDSYEQWECRMSVAALEATLAETKGIVQVTTGNLSLVLGENVLDGYNCIEAWGAFSSLRLVEVLNVVRNRVLEFVLAVWKQAPTAGEASAQETPLLARETVTQIFNTTVYGGAASVVGNANESAVTFNIAQGDWDSLQRALMDQGLTEEDLQALRAAIESDPEPAEARSLGPRVADWIAAMTKKAATGAWEIGVTVASRVVAEAIMKYYGL